MLPPPLSHVQNYILLDTETADWCGRAADGSLDLTKRTPEREWTRLIQARIYTGHSESELLIIDLHPEKQTDESKDRLNRLTELIHSGTTCVLQNAQYDILRLARIGIHIKQFRDTKLLSQLSFAGLPRHKHSLNDIMRRELGFDPYESIGLDELEAQYPDKLAEIRMAVESDEVAMEATEAWLQREKAATKKRLQASDWSIADLTEQQLLYAAMDVSEHFRDAWVAVEWRAHNLGLGRVVEVEHQVIPAIVEMERNGIKMRMDTWDTYIHEWTTSLSKLESEITAIVDPLTQELYPDKFMITLRRKKPNPGKPARVSSKGVILREEIPPQAVGDLTSRQPRPALFPLCEISQTLIDRQEGDYRVGSIVWQELGLTTSQDVMEKAQFNIQSPSQLRILINDILGIPNQDKQGNPHPDNLKFAKGDVVDLIVQCRELRDKSECEKAMMLTVVIELLEKHQEAQVLRKLLTTYGHSYQDLADENGYIRTSFQTCATFTGRMSSSEPNLQNVPRHLQEALFCCEEDEALVSVDYSNMEGRTLFYVTGQLDIYEKLSQGLDLHSMSASFVVGREYSEIVERLPGEDKDSIRAEFKPVRQKAKALTFGVPFGAGVNRVAIMLGCDYMGAKQFLDRYWRQYSIMKEALDNQLLSAVQYGYVTDLAFGRKRFFEPTQEDLQAIQEGRPRGEVLHRWKTDAYNYCAQAGGATCIKVALIDLMHWIKRHPETGIKLRLCIHDSIKVSCKSEYATFVGNEIKRIMETAAEFVLRGARVPADVEIHHDVCAPRFFTRLAQEAA